MSDSLFGLNRYPFVGLSTNSASPTQDPTASTWATRPLVGQGAIEYDASGNFLAEYIYGDATVGWLKTKQTDPSGNPAGNIIIN